VVTLDYLEQRIILSKGGARVSPRELRKEIENTLKAENIREKTKPRQANSIAAHLSPEALELLEKIRRSNN
jgi:predicted RNA-binding protein with PIN domain